MEILEGFVICDAHKKEEIIRTSNSFKNYKFLTLSNLIDKIYGYCDKRSVFSLMDKYELSYELSKDYLAYIPYIEEKTYNDFKLDSFVSIKRYLIQNGLFHKDELFLHHLKQFPVSFIDIYETPQIQHLKKVISNYTKVYTINTKDILYQPSVYCFESSYEEIRYVCNQITELLSSGISLNQIYIANIDKEYAFLLERMAKHYSFAIDLPQIKNIVLLPIVQKFLDLSDKYDSYRDIFDELDATSEYYTILFNLIVDYELEDEKPKKYKKFFYEEFKRIGFKKEKYESMISTAMKDSYTDNDYVFFVGLNLGSAPKIYKDDTFLNDEELERLELATSTIKNNVAKNKLKEILLKTKHMYISYPKYKESEECLPSNIIEEFNLKVEEKKDSFGYSKIEDDLKFGISYTQYVKYKVVKDDLLNYDLSHLKFQEFDNKFKPINPDILKERFNNHPLKMAYSNIKTYFACPFSYYADRILGLNEFKPNMAARLGTFSHAVLEDSYQCDFDFKKSIIKNTNEIAQDSKDKFYFSVMEEVLKCLIEYNKDHENASMLTTIERETHIEYVEDDFIFEGYIDKLLYTEIQDEIYAAIIDYKTGKDIISLDNVEDGFHLQLPSYMFLLSKYEKFKNKKVHILGIYLQKVNIIALDNTEDILSQRIKHFKLQGYSIKDQKLLHMLDPNFEKSTYIMGLSTLKSGEFSRYAKLITEEEQKELIVLVDKLIHQANQDIRLGKFAIEPKRIQQKNESCLFCKYKDICYMKYEDIKELEYKHYPKDKGGEE